MSGEGPRGSDQSFKCNGAKDPRLQCAGVEFRGSREKREATKGERV
jgi:hypothetical protein